MCLLRTGLKFTYKNKANGKLSSLLIKTPMNFKLSQIVQIQSKRSEKNNNVLKIIL